MKLHRFAAAVSALLVGAAAQAQFTMSNAGPLDSADAVGDAGNGNFTANHAGATTVYGRFQFAGDLTSVIGGTFESEAQINLQNLANGNTIDLQPSTLQATFGAINATMDRQVMAWIGNGHNIRAETFESFSDGAGADATWTNLSMTFSNALVTTSLGSFTEGASFTFDTEGSPSLADTELAVFRSDGTLVGTDDDSGSGTLSLLNVGALAAGDYFAVVGGFNSEFVNGFAISGDDAGGYALQLNGLNVGNGTLAAGEFGIFNFSVVAVPEPGSMTLALLAGAAAWARLRRRTA